MEAVGPRMRLGRISFRLFRYRDSSLKLSRNALKGTFVLSLRDTRCWEKEGQWTIGNRGLDISQ